MKWEDYTKIDNLFVLRLYVATLQKIDIPVQYNTIVKPFQNILHGYGDGYGNGNGNGNGYGDGKG